MGAWGTASLLKRQSNFCSKYDGTRPLAKLDKSAISLSGWGVVGW